MKPARYMTDAQLIHAASDLRTAIAVTQPARHSNMDRYIDDYREVISEQQTRERKRCYRRMISAMPGDLLEAIPECMQRPRFLFTAQRINTGHIFRRSQGRAAMFSLYFRGTM